MVGDQKNSTSSWSPTPPSKKILLDTEQNFLSRKLETDSQLGVTFWWLQIACYSK